MGGVNSINGWSSWKGNRVHNGSYVLERSKRDVLISYDLIALRGLRQTEASLMSKGIRVARTKVTACQPAKRHGYAVSLNGRIVAESLSWSVVTHQEEFHAFRSACGFIEGHCKGLTKDESRQLTWVWLGYDWPRDTADPSQLKRKKDRELLAAARATVKRFGYELVPVRFSKAAVGAMGKGKVAA